MRALKVHGPLDSRHQRLARVITVVVLASASFLICVRVGLEFDRWQVFDQYNVLFDADPNLSLPAFTEGAPDRGSVHPNLVPLVYLPIRAAAALVASVGGVTESAVRRALALGVAPLASALGTAFVFEIALLLGLGLLRAGLMGLLCVVSFSNTVFGSVPDHYALGDAVIGLSLWVAARIASDRPVHPWLILCVGVLAVSITVTNLVAFACALWPALFVSDPERRLRKATLRVGWICGASLALALLLQVLFSSTGGVVRITLPLPAPDFIDAYRKPAPAEALPRFPTAVANAVAPPRVDTKRNPLAIRERSRYAFQYTLEPSSRSFLLANPLGLMIVAFFAIGTANGLRARASSVQRSLVSGSLGVLLFNGVLHAFWGNEYFLYSQHWMTPSLVIIACALQPRGRFREALALAMLGLVSWVAASNAARFREMFEVLERVGGSS